MPALTSTADSPVLWDSLCPTPLVQLDQHADRLGLAIKVAGVSDQLLLGDPAEDGLQREVVRDQVAMIAQPPVRGGLAHAVGTQSFRQTGLAPPLAHAVAEAGG